MAQLLDTVVTGNLRVTGTILGTLEGNASSATQTYITSTTPTSATSYYLPFVSSDSSGNQDLRVNTLIRAQIAASGGNASLCIGNNSKIGKLVIYDGSSNNGTIITTSLSDNRNYTLPDASGTISLVSTGTTRQYWRGDNTWQNEYSGNLYQGYAFPNGTNTTSWYEVATFTQNITTTNQVNTLITFYVSSYYSPQSKGILEISCRWTVGSATPAWVRNRWLIADSRIDASKFVATWKCDDASNVTLKLYTNVSGWADYNCVRLAEHSWGQPTTSWELNKFVNATGIAAIPEGETQVASSIDSLGNTLDWSKLNNLPSKYPGGCTGEAGTLVAGEGTSNLARPVWFSYSDNGTTYINGKLGYNSNFTYNPNIGVLTIEGNLERGSSTNLNGILNIRTTAAISTATHYAWGVNHLATAMTKGNTCLITGVDNSTNNAGILEFHYEGANDNKNYVGLGLYNNTGLLKVFKSGQVDIAGALQTGTGISTGAITIGGSATATDSAARKISVSTMNLLLETPTNYGVVFIQNGSNKIRLIGDTFYPETTNHGTLGTSTNSWSNLYSTKIHSVITGSGTVGVAYNATGPINGVPSLWKFNLGLTTPSEGDIITIKIPCAGHASGVYISTDNGTTYYPVSVTGTTALTTHYYSGDCISLVFLTSGGTNSIYPVAGSTTKVSPTGNHWQVLNYYNYYVNTYLRVYAQDTSASSYNGDYPILVSRTVATTLTAKTNGKSTDVYGIISRNTADSAHAPTLNPYTGVVKIAALEVNGGAVSSSTGSGAIKVTGGVGVSGIVYATGFNGPLTGHASDDLALSGGTVSGNVTMSNGYSIQREGQTVSYWQGRDTALVKITSYTGYSSLVSAKTTGGSWEIGPYSDNELHFVYVPDSSYSAGNNTGVISSTRIGPDGKLYNAVWNDYAEYRACQLLPPGACVRENDDGKLTESDERLIPGACIISDTFGYAQGETIDARTPIAVSGRVLAHTFWPREFYHAGQAVCSAPGGTIDIMTREEIRDYPDAIIGIVSEIPNYEYWGTGNIKVNERIWIKVK